jgi:hypothetical protein
LAVLLFSVLGALSWQAMHRYPRQPAPVKLSDFGAGRVPDDSYVTITDAQWDREDMVYYRVSSRQRNTAIAFEDSSGMVGGIAEFSREIAPDDLEEPRVTGVVQPLTDRMVATYQKRGLKLDALAHAEARLYVCTWCGYGNSKGGVIICAILVLAGVLLAAYGLGRALREVRQPHRYL